MISDEAVEAAAQSLARRGQKNPEEFMAWFSRTPLMDEYRAHARAALEAALPHLLASQGCGTGHSGEQLEPAVGATAALASRKRKPRDLGRFPPNATTELVEAAIDRICGCNGVHDCDCATVFNQAARELWREYNEAPPNPTKEA